MCLGAIQNFRVKRVVFGADSPLMGAVYRYYQASGGGSSGSSKGRRRREGVSFCGVLKHPFHEVEVVGGVRAQESSDLMRRFFRERRREGKISSSGSNSGSSSSISRSEVDDNR